MSAGGSKAAAASLSRQRKSTSAPLAAGLGVRHEAGQRAVQARIERAGGLARERVGAERDELEPGVPEHAVERLLAGIAGAAEDGGALHGENYTGKLKIMQY